MELVPITGDVFILFNFSSFVFVVVSRIKLSAPLFDKCKTLVYGGMGNNSIYCMKLNVHSTAHIKSDAYMNVQNLLESTRTLLVLSIAHKNINFSPSHT